MQDRDIIAMETKTRKSYVSYRMASLLVTFADLYLAWRSLLLFETFLSHILQEILCVLSTCVYTWIKKCTCLFKNKGLVKVTASDIHCISVTSRKRCQIESLLLQTTSRMWYITYQIEAILSHLRGHSYCKTLKCDFLYSCAAVDEISTD